MKEAGQKHVHTKGGIAHITPYSTRYASKQEISKFEIPEVGAPADSVHQMLKDELDLDGRPNLNLARYAQISLQLLDVSLQLLIAESAVSSARTWKPKLSN
jgi:hypothetical protein